MVDFRCLHSPFFLGLKSTISHLSRYLGGYFLILALDEIQGLLENLLETQIQMYLVLLEMEQFILPNIMVVRSWAQWLYVPWQVERHNLGLPKTMVKVIDIFAFSLDNSVVHCIFNLGIVAFLEWRLIINIYVNPKVWFTQLLEVKYNCKEVLTFDCSQSTLMRETKRSVGQLFSFFSPPLYAEI